ncbi:MAG: o-succinylbenzoate synthase [Cyanobacteria bacterium P01_H01_bin.130]
MLNLETRYYRRPFKSPLRTAHGLWSVREGIIVRLTTEDQRVGWGEIAPLPWFGTETLAAALAWLASLDDAIAWNELGMVGDKLPCCQFALGCARWMLETRGALGEGAIALKSSRVAGLMPAGIAVLQAWQALYARGHRTLKWKVTGQAGELDIFSALLAALPSDVILRLDANGGLSRSLARDWLTCCDGLPPGRIECFEQPLPPEDFQGLQALSQEFRTPLALDESVATVGQLQGLAAAGWSDLVVVKPAIAGAPQRFFGAPPEAQTPVLQPWLGQFSGIVVSSVFETPVGQWGALRLASRLGDRALGFGTEAWLAPVKPRWLERLWAGEEPFESV